MESSILVELEIATDVTSVLSSIYLFIMRILIFIPLFTVDKAGTFFPSHTPSFNNLSHISLPNMLGFLNLNNSVDSRTLSESLEGFNFFVLLD